MINAYRSVHFNCRDSCDKCLYFKKCLFNVADQKVNFKFSASATLLRKRSVRSLSVCFMLIFRVFIFCTCFVYLYLYISYNLA